MSFLNTVFAACLTILFTLSVVVLEHQLKFFSVLFSYIFGV